MHRRWKAISHSCFDVFLPKRRKRASRDVLKYFYLSILHTQNGFLQTFGVSGPQGPGTSILQTAALLLQIPIPQHKKTAGRCFTPRCLWRKVRNYCLRMCFFQIRCACGSHPRSTANRHGKKPCLFAGGELSPLYEL